MDPNKSKEEVKKIIAKHYAKFRKTCAAVLEEGIKVGVFKKLDTYEYSAYIIAVIDGVSLQWLFDESAFDYDKTIKQTCTWVLETISV